MPVLEGMGTRHEDRATRRWDIHEGKLDRLVEKVGQLVALFEKDMAWRKEQVLKTQAAIDAELKEGRPQFWTGEKWIDIMAERDRYKRILEKMRDIWAKEGP